MFKGGLPSIVAVVGPRADDLISVPGEAGGSCAARASLLCRRAPIRNAAVPMRFNGLKALGCELAHLLEGRTLKGRQTFN
jgi:hypothetical protein